MKLKSSIYVKSIALILSFVSMSAGVMFFTKTKPHDSRVPFTEHNKRAIELSMNRGTTDARSLPSTLVTGKKDPNAALRKSIESQARKQGKSTTEVAIDQINSTKLNGTAGSIYDDLMLAFWEQPEVFLESLKATAQGKELQYATAVYLSKAGEEMAKDHFEKAYSTLSPGGARSSVARSWASIVGTSEGIDAAITLIQKFEMRQEKISAVLELESQIQRSGLECSADQLGQLKLLENTK